MRETTENLEANVRERTAELRLANETKDKMLSIIAHDLRSSVGLVRSVTRELAAARGELDPELVAAANGSAEFAYGMLEDLLLWASTQSGRIAPEPIAFELRAETAATLAGLGALAARKSIDVCSEIPDGMLAVADVDMVKTILRNLVTNAIKFSHAGGEVRIRARRESGRVHLDVEDRGVGIAHERQGRLFDLGERSPSTAGTGGERGTGLGLILCRDLARRNGGDVVVASAPGEGSTFTLTLPASAEASAA